MKHAIVALSIINEIMKPYIFEVNYFLALSENLIIMTATENEITKVSSEGEGEKPSKKKPRAFIIFLVLNKNSPYPDSVFGLLDHLGNGP